MSANDPSLTPANVFLHDLPATLAPRHHQGIPGIAVSPAGTLWATWYGGGENEGPDNYVMLAHRNTESDTWPEPWLVVRHAHPNIRTFDPTLWLDPQRRLWLFWAQGYSGAVAEIWDGRAGVWGICCEHPDTAPEIWSAPQRFCDGIMMNKPTLDDAGHWIFPVSIWVEAPYHPAVAPAERGPMAVLVSKNGRQVQVQPPATIPDPTYDEHHVIPLTDGRWALWARTRGTSSTAAVCYSTDRGQHWTPATYGNLPCPCSRFFVGRLQSGALLLISHDGTRAPNWPSRSFLTAWVSDDEGQSWIGGLLLDEREQVSYPDVDQGPDGRIHVIYDRDRTGDREILLTSFTEQQVRDGGDQAITRQTVSRLGPKA